MTRVVEFLKNVYGSLTTVAEHSPSFFRCFQQSPTQLPLDRSWTEPDLQGAEDTGTDRTKEFGRQPDMRHLKRRVEVNADERITFPAEQQPQVEWA